MNVPVLRAILITPVLLTCAAAVAIMTARIMGLHLRLSPILVAAGIGLVASEAALVPTLLRPNASPTDGFQRAFFGTVLHLALMGALAATAIFAVKLGDSFVYWILGSYWITLAGLCVVFVGLLRAGGRSVTKAAK